MAQITKRKRQVRPVDIPVPAVPSGKGPFVITEAPPTFGGLVTIIPPAEDGKLYLPVGDDAESQAVRFHEYAQMEFAKVRPGVAPRLEWHVKKKGADPAYLDAALDVVVNGMAAQRGLAEEISHLPLADVSATSPDKNKALWLLRKLSLTAGKALKTSVFSGQPAESNLVRLLAASLGNLGRQYSHSPGTSDETIADTIAAHVKKLQDYFETKAALESMKSMERADLAPMTQAVMVEAMKGNGLSPDQIEALTGLTEESKEWRETWNDGITTGVPLVKGENNWGSMSLKQMTLDALAKRRAPSRVPAYVGGFRNPVRALLPAMDGRAWAIRRKKLGGTILLDMSGSMSLDVNDIRALLATAPLSTIAGYAGETRHGYLWIMAKGGRYSTSIPYHPGGNVVDGPALRWLAKQQKPRVWISDGGVTGINDGQTTNLLADALWVVTHGDIERYQNIPTYLAAAGAPAPTAS